MGVKYHEMLNEKVDVFYVIDRIEIYLIMRMCFILYLVRKRFRDILIKLALLDDEGV